jgi:hypothetical protein
MDALQADASAIPDDSVDHVTNVLVNMQVTARAAATVPASTPVDPSDRSAAAASPAAAIVPASTLVDLADISAAAVRAQATAVPPAAAIVPASTLVDFAKTTAAAVRARDSTAQDTKMLGALESILHHLEALESPRRSPHSPPSSPSGPYSCSSASIAVEVPVVSSLASRRLYKNENPPPFLKGCMEWPDEYERAVNYWALLEADELNKNALPPDLWVFSLHQCYALLRMRPLSIPWAECSVVISCGKVDYDKSG